MISQGRNLVCWPAIGESHSGGIEKEEGGLQCSGPAFYFCSWWSRATCTHRHGTMAGTPAWGCLGSQYFRRPPWIAALDKRAAKEGPVQRQQSMGKGCLKQSRQWQGETRVVPTSAITSRATSATTSERPGTAHGGGTAAWSSAPPATPSRCTARQGPGTATATTPPPEPLLWWYEPPGGTIGDAHHVHCVCAARQVIPTHTF
jgi:hypothetical protein